MTDKAKKDEKKAATEEKKSVGEVELIHDVARGTKDTDKEFGFGGNTPKIGADGGDGSGVVEEEEEK